MKTKPCVEKNELINLEITGMSSDGNGVGRYEGMAVFVPFTAVGDKLTVKIVKVQPRYAFGIIDSIIEPSSDRIAVDCPSFGRCGGCDFRHISYQAELKYKRDFVCDALKRLGGLDVEVGEIIPSPNVDRYRNKIQLPVVSENGRLKAGFYAARSHRTIDASGCLLEPQIISDIADECCEILNELGITAYDEKSGSGLLRHILLRISVTGEVMVCLVINGKGFKKENDFCSLITDKFGCIKSIIINTNTDNTNVILGKNCRTLWGDDCLFDMLCGVPVRISARSFFQVNNASASLLYRNVAELLNGNGHGTLLDLYCGAGTIGLSLADDFDKIIGVDSVSSAIEDARFNADKTNNKNAEFICADAGEFAAEFISSGRHLDAAVIDPPRQGCDERVIEMLTALSPDKLAMVSCNPATLARDLKALTANGFEIQSVTPVDLFARTKHIETVALLSKLHEAKHHVSVKLDMDEMDITSVESKATYEEIKKYVAEHNNGMKVSSLNIAQVKRKCGLELAENYNLPKSEDARQPQCTKEKEDAIMEAMNAFKMR